MEKIDLNFFYSKSWQKNKNVPTDNIYKVWLTEDCVIMCMCVMLCVYFIFIGVVGHLSAFTEKAQPGTRVEN